MFISKFCSFSVVRKPNIFTGFVDMFEEDFMAISISGIVRGG